MARSHTELIAIMGNLKKQKALPEVCHSALFGSDFRWCEFTRQN